MEHAIVIQDVTKRFRETVAVSHVTACFETGKIHGIIGRNGSGKTVLFKCICGLFPVTEGSIEVLGQRMGDGKRVPKGVGANPSRWRMPKEYFPTCFLLSGSRPTVAMAHRILSRFALPESSMRCGSCF